MADKYDPFRIPAYDPSPAFRLGAGPGSGYGFRKDPIKKSGETSEAQKNRKPEFHSGQDFVAPAGTPIPNAASGVVVYSGFNKQLGNVVIVKNDRGDYSLYGHMQDGDRAQLGQRLEEGETIGAVGQTGTRVTGVHLHYSVIRPEAGKIVERGPGSGGPIGIHLDGSTTNEPAGLPRYLNETSRAMGVMSGGSAVPGTPPPDRPGDPFFNPFNRADPRPDGVVSHSALNSLSFPAPQTPSRSNPPARAALPPNAPQSPPGASGPQPQLSPGMPVPGADGPTSFGGPDGPMPLVPQQPSSSQGKRSELDDTPVRVLSRRADLSPPSGDASPLAPASAPPLLGLVSGKPMPDWPVQPSIFQPKDQSSPDDNELFQRWMRWVNG